jgi:hypothetical protein
MFWRREKYLKPAGNLTMNLLWIFPQHNRYTYKAYYIRASLTVLEQAKMYIGPVCRTLVCEMKETLGIRGTTQNFIISRENNESAATVAAQQSVKRKVKK